MALFLAAAALLLTPSGCGKDGGVTEPEPPQPPVISTETRHGGVNLQEIGGTQLKVGSVWDQEHLVGQDGSFQVQASRVGAQLLVATDSADRLRGLAVSVPGPGASTRDVRFDSRSTALALLMLTPGILAVDSTTARLLAHYLPEMPEFESLAALLRQRLPSTPLDQVVEAPDVVAALDTCIGVLAWSEGLVQKLTAVSKAPGQDARKLLEGGFSAYLGDDTNPSRAQIRLANISLRYVAVHRREIDSRGVEKRVVSLFDGVNRSMGGARPGSWFDLSQWLFRRAPSLGDPTRHEDVVDFSPAGDLSRVEYWVVGIGRDAGSATPPPSVDLSMGRAVAASALIYTVFPLIDLALGVEKTLGSLGYLEGHPVWQDADEIWLIAETVLDEDEIWSAVQRDDWGAVRRPLVNFSMLALRAIAEHGAGKTAFLHLPKAAWMGLGRFIAYGTIGISLANVSMAAWSWAHTPHIVTVPVENPRGDRTPPDPVTDLHVVGRTHDCLHLAWTAPGDDGMSGGIARAYIIRFSEQRISLDNWAAATNMQGEPPPAQPGSSQDVWACGLNPATTYYFALRTTDDAGNISDLSNNASGTTTSLPTACFVITPDHGPPHTQFEFDASCSSDPEDSLANLRFRWDWEDDGQYDTVWSPSPTANHRYDILGDYRVRLQVKDTEDVTSETTKSIPVHWGNNPPVACFVVTPDHGTTSTQFSFDASCSSDPEDAISALHFDWDWENDGTYDLSKQGDPSASHVFSLAGTYHVALRVVDSGSASNRVIHDLAVLSRPSVPVLISPEDGATNQPLSLTLRWNPATGAADYHVRVSTYRDFSSLFVDRTGIPETEHPLSGLQNSITYYWHVAGHNSYGDGDWSSTWHFTTASQPAVGRVAGAVLDASSRAPIDGVRVSVYRGASFVTSTATTASGNYEASLTAERGYRFVFSKQGYLNAEYWGVDVVEGQSFILETVLQVDTSHSGLGSIQGTIDDALNGDPVAGAELRLRVGINVTSGTVVATASTDLSGSYAFEDVAAGNYTVEASHSEYSTATFTVVCLGGLASDRQDATMTPVLPPGWTRIILTWGAEPQDLDSHFTGPLPEGGRFHMYFGRDGESNPWPTIVNLDRDDTFGNGTETTTLFQQISGTYRFSVHDFTNLDSNSSDVLSRSDAQVLVYQSSDLVNTFNVPPNREGTLWTVFEMNGSSLTPINEMSYWSDYENIPKPGTGQPRLFKNLTLQRRTSSKSTNR